MIRWLSAFFLFLFLAGTSSSPAIAVTLEEVAARRAFLWDLRERVQPLLDLNKVNALTIQECLNQIDSVAFNGLSKENIDPKSKWSHCKSALAVIRENTLVNYSAVRRALFLSQIFEDGNLDMLLIYLRSNAIRKNLGLPPLGIRFGKGDFFATGIKIDNPLVFSLNRESIPYPNWEREELIRAIGDENGKNPENAGLETFNSIFRKTCEKLNEDAKGKWFELRFSFCKDVYLSVSKDNKELIFNYAGDTKNLNSTLNAIETSRTFLRQALSGQAKKWTEEFKALVQLHPYVGLVTQAVPSRLEFISAYKIIAERASKTVSEFTELSEKNQLQDYNKADPYTLLMLMKYNPVAKTLVEKPGVELTKFLRIHPYYDLNQLFESLLKDYHWQEMKDLGWTIAKVSTANVFLCWIPIARGPRVLGSLIYNIIKLERFSEVLAASFTPICYGVGGGLINLGFLWSGYSDYTEAYNEVFSSFEKETMVRELNSLTDKEREIVWSAVTLPLGTGLLKAASSKVKNLVSRILAGGQ